VHDYVSQTRRMQFKERQLISVLSLVESAECDAHLDVSKGSKSS